MQPSSLVVSLLAQRKVADAAPTMVLRKTILSGRARREPRDDR